MASATAIAVTLSAAASAAVCLLVFGPDPQGSVSIATVVHVVAALSIGVPAVTCPLLVLRSTLLMRDLARAHDDLERLAQTDQLTGVHNRRGFDVAALRLAETRRRLPEAERTAAALMCDIDVFKRVNDAYGHAFGDAVLRHVASALRAGAPRGTVIGRRGGDEFALFLLGVPRSEALALAERLREACGMASVAGAADAANITVSIGLATHSRFDGDIAALLRLADGALYEAKEKGRNRVVMAWDGFASADAA